MLLRSLPTLRAAVCCSGEWHVQSIDHAMIEQTMLLVYYILPPAKKRKARTIDNAEAKKIAIAMMQEHKPGWELPLGLTWRKDNQCWFFRKSVKWKLLSLGCYPNTIEGLQMAVLVARRFDAEYTEEFKATITEDNVEDKRKEIQRRCMVKQGQDCASDLCEELNVKPPAKKKVKVAQHEEDGDE
eukprot:scaffold4982_cov92-Skeletonema_dohrnii-CCMP3373.AAC.1